MYNIYVKRYSIFLPYYCSILRLHFYLIMTETNPLAKQL